MTETNKTEVTPITAENVTIKHVTIPLDAIKVVKLPNCPPRNTTSRWAQREKYIAFDIPGVGLCRVSDRFWTTWSRLYKQHRSIFKLFDYDETFVRTQETHNNNLRIAVELWPNSGSEYEGRALAATDPTKPLLPVDTARDLFAKFSGKGMRYENGVMSGEFAAPYPLIMDIIDSKFSAHFQLDLPLDGFGLPMVYLALMRETDNTYFVARSTNSAFRTKLQMSRSDDTLGTVLTRALDSFSNEEGCRAMKDRFEAADQSWASFSQYRSLFNALDTASKADVGPVLGGIVANKLQRKLDMRTHYPMALHRLGSENDISKRASRVLPVQATVFDLIDFAATTASEYRKISASNHMNEWVGDQIVNEYDLEGSKAAYPRFLDQYLADMDSDNEADTEEELADISY